jgi:hypothetical protein
MKRQQNTQQSCRRYFLEMGLQKECFPNRPIPLGQQGHRQLYRRRQSHRLIRWYLAILCCQRHHRRPR